MVDQYKNLLLAKCPVMTTSIIIFSIVSRYFIFPHRWCLSCDNACNYSMQSDVLETQLQTHARAFILTVSCVGARYNFTMHNLERSFPHFFSFHCCQSVPLDDPRIPLDNDTLLKKFSAGVISTALIWTYEIPKYASSELEWSFFFEDDVNIIDTNTTILQLTTKINYTQILLQLMYDKEVQENDGLFYLGICGPTFNFTDRPLQAKAVINETVFHYRGYGFCGHALAFTTRRARLFWTDISS